MHSTLHKKPRPSAVAGTSILEAVVAAALVAGFMGGLFVMSSTAIRVLQAHRETASANECLQERFEQIRSANWTQITSAQAIRDRILNTPASASGRLPNLQERITVNVYPAPSPAPTPIQVMRHPDGTVTIDSQPATNSLSTSPTVRLDVQDSWQSAQGQRTRVRESSAVIALGGITK
jgi:hypothetical protein